MAEYFEHFPVLEIDYTFYSPLLEESGKLARNFHIFRLAKEGRIKRKKRGEYVAA